MFKPILALAALAFAAPVLAQDASATTFNGPFVGIQGGWQQDRQSLTVTDGGAVSNSRQNKDGFGYGGQVGYDFRLSPKVVVGAEVDLTGRTGSRQLDNSTLDLKQGRTIAATARLGYLASPDGLVYVRGGYANARYTLRDNNTDISESRDGLTVGAGYEQQLARNVSARVEYAYSQFGNDNLPALAANLGADQAKLKYSRNEVKAGLNFRF